MKKQIKASLLLLSLVATVIFPSTASAEDNSYDSLQSLANEYIKVTVSGNETTYANIQDFYDAARAEFPDAADIELAKTVLAYTNQDYSNMSQQIILETLDFTEITSVDEVYRTLQDGTVELLTTDEVNDIINNDNEVSPNSVWTSGDGYLRMTTYANASPKTPYGTPYTLSCTATWLKIPTFLLTDTLAIVYGGTFDDSYVITCTLTENAKCSHCGKTFTWNEAETFGPWAGSDPGTIVDSDIIEIDSSRSQAIGGKFDLQNPKCEHVIAPVGTGNFAQISKIECYVRFRILCSNTTEARSAYAHTRLTGSVNISGTITAGGVEPSFSGNLNILAEKYTAVPVTLRVS